MLISDGDETSFFVTVAICKKDKYEVFDAKFTSYKRRIVVIAKRDFPGFGAQ